jgi:hypothetical protein
MTIKKCLFRNWQLAIDTEVFHRDFANPCTVRCKTKGAVRAVCALLCNCQSGAPIKVRDGVINLKGPHTIGDGLIFSKNLRASLIN